MAYTVLARKYRSRTFDEIVGQGPIATTLVNAIKTGRIHHGYLFTGTRGVGKTSMARILAKALNCLSSDGPTTTPCGTCAACVAIAEGQDIDVVEIDAASNTGVDNIRELRSNTAYRPARSRFKIYIIDEVHMLSTGAFNALLKTLEEPPEHVKFILATTEIQKVPATIQSRCQRFDFRNISPDEIAALLAKIVKDEGATAEDAVVRRVARLANGSMRDALSILDQLLSVSPKKLTAQVLDELLPPPQDEQLLTLLRHAADGDAGAVLADGDALLSRGRGLEVFCNDTIDVLRSLMLMRVCGPNSPLVDVSAAARDEYAQLSKRFELSQYVQMIALLEELRRNVRYSGAGRALTDALLIRFARMHEWAPIEQLIAQLGDADARSASPAAAPRPADEKKKPIAAEVAPPAPPPSRFQPDRPSRAPEPLRPPQSDYPPAIARRAAAPDATAPNDDLPPIPLDADIIEEAPDGVALADEPLPVEDGAPPTATRGSISREERARILKDPVVRRVMDLFDGELVYVERPSPAPTPQPTE